MSSKATPLRTDAIIAKVKSLSKIHTEISLKDDFMSILTAGGVGNVGGEKAINRVCYKAGILIPITASRFAKPGIESKAWIDGHNDRQCMVSLAIDRGKKVAKLSVTFYRYRPKSMDDDPLFHGALEPLTESDVAKDSIEMANRMAALGCAFSGFFDAANAARYKPDAELVHYEGPSPSMRFSTLFRGRAHIEKAIERNKKAAEAFERSLIKLVLKKPLKECGEKEVGRFFGDGSAVYCLSPSVHGGYVIDHSRACTRSPQVRGAVYDCDGMERANLSAQFAVLHADVAAVNSMSMDIIQSINNKRDVLLEVLSIIGRIKSDVDAFRYEEDLVKSMMNMHQEYLDGAGKARPEISMNVVLPPKAEWKKPGNKVYCIDYSDDKGVDWNAAMSLFGITKGSASLAIIIAMVLGCQVIVNRSLLASPSGMGRVRTKSIGDVADASKRRCNVGSEFVSGCNSPCEFSELV
jgi:hypothetical protein